MGHDTNLFLYMAIFDTLELLKNSFTTKIAPAGLSGNRTLNLPDKDGTLAVTSDIREQGKGSTSSLVPTNPAIGDYWISPPGSNVYADVWMYCDRGGVADWWSAMTHAETTYRDIYISSGYAFGVNVPIYSANQIYIEATTLVATATGAAHSTTLYWQVYAGYVAGTGTSTSIATALLGDTKSLAVNASRRLESNVGWLLPATCLRLGVYLLPFGGSVRGDFCTVGVNYRVRKPASLGI